MRMRQLSPMLRWSLLWASRSSRGGAVMVAAGFALSLLVFAGMTVLDQRTGGWRLAVAHVVSADVDHQ